VWAPGRDDDTRRCGLRASEVRASRWDIVDLVRGLLHATSKNGSRRCNHWEATSCSHRPAFRIKALAEAYRVFCRSGNGAVASKRVIGFAQEATERSCRQSYCALRLPPLQLPMRRPSSPSAVLRRSPALTDARIISASPRYSSRLTSKNTGRR